MVTFPPYPVEGDNFVVGNAVYTYTSGTWVSQAVVTRRILTYRLMGAGQSLSAELEVPDGLHFVGLMVPAGWTTADITFVGGTESGGIFYPILDSDGYEVKVANVSPSRAIVLPTGQLPAWPYVMIRSGTSTTPVLQANAVTLTCILMSYD